MIRAMQNEFFAFLRLIFFGLFVFTLLAGVYLCRNYHALFGPTPQIPSENDSARAFSKLQVFSIWGHAVFLTGGFAFLLR